MEQHPPVISRFWYSIDWDVEAIWKLNLPIVTVPICDLAWHLDVPIWSNAAGVPYRVTPREVIAYPERAPAERRRIFDASMKFPLDLYRNRGRLMILDGVHRFTKAWIEERPSLAARFVPESAVIQLAVQ